MKELDVVAVDFNSGRFADILIDRVKKTSDCKIVIVNNGDERAYDTDKVIRTGGNLYHGAGLDIGIQESSSKYVAIFDIDAFPLMNNWDKKILEYINNLDLDLVTVQDDERRIYAPCFSIINREKFLKSGISMKDGFDTCMEYFHSIPANKVMILPRGKNIFKKSETWLGSTYYLLNEPIAYHHWYSTRFNNREELDGHDKQDFLMAREEFFNEYDSHNFSI